MLVLKSARQAVGTERWMGIGENNDFCRNKPEHTAIDWNSCMALPIFQLLTCRRSWPVSLRCHTAPGLGYGDPGGDVARLLKAQELSHSARWAMHENNTAKPTQHRRICAFELWCWRRLLRVPWAARRSNQSILKEISPEHSLEGLMLKLKLQYFGHLM